MNTHAWGVRRIRQQRTSRPHGMRGVGVKVSVKVIVRPGVGVCRTHKEGKVNIFTAQRGHSEHGSSQGKDSEHHAPDRIRNPY